MNNVSSPMSAGSPSDSLAPKKWEPPKDWEVLTDSEKIERVREVLKQNNHSNYGRILRLEEMVNKLMAHSHQGDKLVIPINTYTAGAGLIGASDSLTGSKYI